MAEGSGVAEARGGSIVVALLAAMISGITVAEVPAPPAPRGAAVPSAGGGVVLQAGGPAGTADAAAPLPGAEWNDPDSVNWADAPAAERASTRDRILERRADRGGLPGARLLDRLRGDPRSPSGPPHPGETAAGTRPAERWPEPATLVAHLGRLGAAPAPAGEWASAALAHVRAAGETAGPADPAAATALLALGEDVDAGMALADELADATLATDVRRAALAVARRVAVWRAAAAACAPAGGSRDITATFVAGSAVAATGRLLDALERFESTPVADTAADVRSALGALGTQTDAAAIGRAVGDHYLAPNVRVAVHRSFVSRMLPAETVTTGPMQDFVLGRPVHGTRRVRQSTGVRFVPDPDEIRCELLVDGVVTSRTVAESGPVAIHSRATAEFTVRKPVTLATSGLVLGRALGTASNRSQLADISTDFDSLPIWGSLMRSIARNQHDEHHAEATREVNDKIVTRACREVDAQADPKFRDVAERLRQRVWQPLVGLGLEPTAVSLETTADLATARLRLAGADQLAAHTPRPRCPADALVSVQVHESALNNACGNLGLAGRRFTVEELVRTICGRLGVPPRIPDDLPADVEIAFAATDPLRVECRDGLVHVRMALDAISSGRRCWYDIVAHVSYRPVASGPQVLLERDGPVRLSGEGQQGRMEIGLRTIVGKIFPKERPVPLVPAAIAADERLAGIQAVQAVSTDGWFALALAQPAPAGGAPAAPAIARPPLPARRVTRR